MSDMEILNVDTTSAPSTLADLVDEEWSSLYEGLPSFQNTNEATVNADDAQPQVHESSTEESRERKQKCFFVSIPNLKSHKKKDAFQMNKHSNQWEIECGKTVRLAFDESACGSDAEAMITLRIRFRDPKIRAEFALKMCSGHSKEKDKSVMSVLDVEGLNEVRDVKGNTEFLFKMGNRKHVDLVFHCMGFCVQQNYGLGSEAKGWELVVEWDGQSRKWTEEFSLQSMKTLRQPDRLMKRERGAGKIKMTDKKSHADEREALKRQYLEMKSKEVDSMPIEWLRHKVRKSARLL